MSRTLRAIISPSRNGFSTGSTLCGQRGPSRRLAPYGGIFASLPGDIPY
jgi:hypothetical protein